MGLATGAGEGLDGSRAASGRALLWPRWRLQALPVERGHWTFLGQLLGDGGCALALLFQSWA